MITKLVTVSSVVIGIFFIIGSTFNHINPWLAVGLFVGVLYFAAHKIDKIIKKEK